MSRHPPALLACVLFVVAWLVGCGSPPAPTGQGEAAGPPTPPVVLAREPVAETPLAGGPTLLLAGLELRKLAAIDAGSVRMALNPRDGWLYLLNPAGGLSRVDPDAPAAPRLVASVAEMVGDAAPAGMAFGPDGSLFVVANRRDGNQTSALIRRGVPDGDGFSWENLAVSAPYPTSGTPFDHLFNGVVVSPDGAQLFVNSGSRTDHGEVEANNGAFPDTREVPLTARVFVLPADASNLELPNDEAAQEAAGLVFVRGTRNAYDLEFAPNGELFAVDNGPDADFPDELNWLRPGRHYGFPWRFGSQANPQASPGYNSADDPRLHPDFTAVNSGTYRDDPAFPPPPGPFTDPVVNHGPAATQYRADDGSERDAAAEGGSLSTFTAHRSPLGLVFAVDQAMPADLRGDANSLSAFVLSWGAAGGTLSDAGQDVLHLRLWPAGDNYQLVATPVARGFANPIDAVLVGDRLYVSEFGADPAIWEIRFVEATAGAGNGE